MTKPTRKYNKGDKVYFALLEGNGEITTKTGKPVCIRSSVVRSSRYDKDEEKYKYSLKGWVSSWDEDELHGSEDETIEKRELTRKIL